MKDIFVHSADVDLNGNAFEVKSGYELRHVRKLNNSKVRIHYTGWTGERERSADVARYQLDEEMFSVKFRVEGDAMRTHHYFTFSPEKTAA